MACVDALLVHRGPPERDHRLDFCRGLAFFCIVVDHTRYSLLSRITLVNYGFCDAAEIFVLLAGISSALTYAGSKESLKRIGSRAATIYAVHLALLIVAGLIVVLARQTGLDVAHQSGLGRLVDEPAAVLWPVLTLQLQPEYFDILPLYFVMLIGLPVLLAHAKRSATTTLALSAAVWALANAYRLNFPSSRDGGWYFNPLTWQFLLTIGVVVGLSMRRGDQADFRARFAYLYVAALTYLVVAYAYAAPWTGLPVGWLKTMTLVPVDVFGPVSKTYSSGFRILNALSLFTVFAWHVRADAPWLQHTWAKRVGAAGRRPLVAFSVTTIVALFGTLIFATFGKGLTAQIIVNATAIAALVGSGTVEPRLVALRVWSVVSGRNSAVASAHAVRQPGPSPAVA